MFSSKIDDIIEESNKVKKYRNTYTNQIRNSARNRSNSQLKDKKEKQEIMNRIIANEIDEIMKKSR